MMKHRWDIQRRIDQANRIGLDEAIAKGKEIGRQLEHRKKMQVIEEWTHYLNDLQYNSYDASGRLLPKRERPRSKNPFL